MAYLLAIPVVYYGSSFIANKTMDALSVYVVDTEELVDESEAILKTATSVLKSHKDMLESHEAYVAKTYVEQGVDALQYMSDSVKRRKSLFKRSFKKENKKLRKLQDELERRLRLFYIAYSCAAMHTISKPIGSK